MEYSEKLKDPRWQKKRAEILQRDEYKCKICDANEKTLHVHHLVYFQDTEPWDINSGFLVTLCEDCHAPLTQEAREKGCWSDAEVFRDYIGILLNTIWASKYGMYDLRKIGMVIAKINIDNLNW
jgi:hypothetical protein